MSNLDGSSTVLLSLTGSAHGSLQVSGKSTLTLAFVLSGSGDLYSQVYLKAARAISSTRIRLDFSGPVDNDAGLRSPSSYYLPSIAAITSVEPPAEQTNPTYVELVVSEMRQGNFYFVGVNYFSSTIKAKGVLVRQSGASFTGIGISPQIQVVVATSSTTAEVRFSERMQTGLDLMDPLSYVFDGGLSVTGVVSFDGQIVTLQTSQQTAGQLYTLTVTGVFYDDPFNAMVSPSSSPMLGFTAGAPDEALLSIRMYQFLIEGLREEDQTNGNAFLEKFLEGPQQVWASTIKTIMSVPDLWSAEKIPAELLPFLQRIVGWTKDLDYITGRLDSATLRRLIATSIPFWKQRSTEDSIQDILRLVTGARMYIQNWFDLRFIMDETQIGEDHVGNDSWLLNSPDVGDADPNTYNIRIVDDGHLDKRSVLNFARLTRPINERVLISYLGFLDQFTTDGDSSQWTPVTGTPIVSGGTLKLSNTSILEEIYANPTDSLKWSNYTVTFKVKTNGASSWSMEFYRSANSDMYKVQVDTSINTVSLNKRVANVQTSLGGVVLDTLFGEKIFANTYYSIRIEITPLSPGSATNSIRVYWDGVPILEINDASQGAGTIGITKNGSVTLEIDDVELFFNPIKSDFIDINT